MATVAVTTAQAGRGKPKATKSQAAVTSVHIFPFNQGRYAQLVGGGFGSPIYLSVILEYIAVEVFYPTFIIYILLPKKNAKGRGEIGYVSRILDGFIFVGIDREEERVR